MHSTIRCHGQGSAVQSLNHEASSRRFRSEATLAGCVTTMMRTLRSTHASLDSSTYQTLTSCSLRTLQKRAQQIDRTCTASRMTRAPGCATCSHQDSTTLRLARSGCLALEESETTQRFTGGNHRINSHISSMATRSSTYRTTAGLP